MPMRIAFFGSGAFGVPTLAALCEAGHEIVCVVTQPDRPGGRGRKPMATPIKQLAEGRGFRLIQPADVNDPAVVADVVSAGADVAIVVAFGQRLGRDLLAGLGWRAVNLHSSLLPKFRGAAPINWAILCGERETGVTAFRLAERMDTGNILATESTLIGLEETAAELHDRLAGLGPGLVDRVLPMFADGACPDGEAQDDAVASKAPKLSKADGHIRFDRPAAEVARRIRGLWSWPGATCRFVSADGGRSEQVILARAVMACDADTGLAPGTVTDAMTAACQPGTIRLIELCPAGKRLMPFEPAYVNGRHVTAGDRFESIE